MIGLGLVVVYGGFRFRLGLVEACSGLGFWFGFDFGLSGFRAGFRDG